MAEIPVPRSYNQILGDQIDAFLSRFGLKALKVGSPVLSIFEASAQSQLRSSEDVFTLLASDTLDQASGTALDRAGADEDLPRLTQTPASGTVSITDTSFAKISTKIFQGAAAPIIGSVHINVPDATQFPPTGSIYLGRGTNNYEGPLPYTSILPPGLGGGQSGGSFYTFVLSSGTLRFHNLGEGVVLAQGGNRNIAAGTIVQTPQGNVVQAVTFKTLFASTIPDGEVTITGVNVISQKPGVIGNVIANGITQFASPPFAGASVTNPLPYTNGLATEDDDTYRERIRQKRQTRVKGTSLALQTSAIGVVSTDENKRVLSSSVVAQSGLATVLYIDDGTGYEEIDEGVAIESFTDLAAGGEDFFKVAAAPPIAKAHLITNLTSPFTLASGNKLAMAVGGVVTEHTFDQDEFTSISNATAYEVVASINADSTLLWAARTLGSGSQVVVFAKSDSNEDIQYRIPSGEDANAGLSFSIGRVDTMRLYKNDRLLSKDGSLASIQSTPTSLWNTLSGDQTLVIEVDGIIMSFGTVIGYSAAAQFAAITSEDFINADTGFTSIGINTATAWAQVLNLRVPGITATVASGLIVITSNKGRSNLASVSILSGSLVTNHLFTVASSQGASNDYKLDRNTGELRLTSALVAGDRLAAGSVNTRAFLESPQLGVVNVSSLPANLWFSVDGNASTVAVGVTSSTPISITIPTPSAFAAYVQPWGIRARVASAASQTLFTNVQVGDQAVFWDPNFNVSGTYPVSAVGNGTFFDIDLKGGAIGRQAHTATVLLDGRILVTGGLIGPNLQATASAELFTPSTGTYVSIPGMSIARTGHAASILPSGKVLVAGGVDASGNFLTSAEVFDPTAKTWTTTGPLAHARAYHTATALNDGTVLVTGGWQGSTTFTNTCEIFTEGAGTWASTGSLATARARHSVVHLPSDNVIAAAGENNGGRLQSSELYNTGTGIWSSAGNFTGAARHSTASTLFNTLYAMFSGGSTAASTVTDVPVTTVDVYLEGTGWSVGAVLHAAAARHQIVLLPSTNILLVGGGANEAQYWTQGSNTWAASSAMLSKDPVKTGKRVNNALVVSGGVAYAIGGYNSTIKQSYSVVEYWDDTAKTWNVANPALTTLVGVYPLNKGFSVARSSSRLQPVSLPINPNYTAATIVPLLASQLLGASASVYRTTAYRVNTNTFNDIASGTVLAGDIALMAANTNGQRLGLDVADATVNLTGHLASIESGNSDLGTPSFADVQVIGTGADEFHVDVAASSTDPYYAGYQLVGLRQVADSDAVSDVSNWGHTKNFSSAIAVDTLEGTTQTLNLRLAPENGWLPLARAYFAEGYSFGSNDLFTVLVDGNVESERFALNMFRTLKTVGTTYGSTNTFKDADNANQSLAQGFGYSGGPTGAFDFNDFAILMAARTKSHAADSTKAILWRYTSLGPDGNNARLRYVYPVAASSAIAVGLNNNGPDADTNDISISLGSGPKRVGYTLGSAYSIGIAYPSAANGMATVQIILAYKVSSASRTSNVTTLTLTLPAGVTAHNLTNGGTYNFVSSSGSFSSGNYVLTGVTGTTVTYAEVAGDVGATANPGILYLTPSLTATLAGASIAQYDLFRFESNATVDALIENVTMRIDSDPVANPYGIQTLIESTTVNTVPTYYVVGDSTAFSVFPQLNQTSSAIVTAVNALQAASASVPVKATLISDGTGIINASTAEELDQADSWYSLSDGYNFVSSTTAPGSLGADYSLTFKLPITAGLATNSDWANEVVKIVPRTAKNVAAWFGVAAVSGLFTSATCTLSSRGHKVQLASITPGSSGSIQVQGGTSNSATAAVSGTALANSTRMIATVEAADTQGMVSGGWVSIDNTIALPRSGSLYSGTILESIALYGTVAQYTLDSSSLVYTVRSQTQGASLSFEAEGKFIRIDDLHFADSLGALSLGSVLEGDWVRLSINGSAGVTYNVASVNTGIYRVVRVTNTSYIPSGGGSIYIENPNAIDQDVAFVDVTFYTPDSMMPGDVLSQSTNLWGAGNKGAWNVTSVGAQRFNIAPGQLTRTSNVITVDLGVGHPHNFTTNDRFIMTPGESLITTVNGDGSPIYFTVASTPTTHSFTFANTGSDGTNLGAQAVVGNAFQNVNMFEVDNSSAIISTVSSATAPLGSEEDLVQIIEGTPARTIKQILSIAPNQTNSSFSDMKFTTNFNFGHTSAAAGSIISALDKLAFSTDIRTGIDGYEHSIGLIGEVNRVIYGDPNDPATYPGVAAAGATVNIQGPLVKRIQVSLSIRIRQGDRNDIEDKVKSAVAAAINGTGIGKPIALSDLIGAARQVTGVVAVAMIKPVLTAGTDIISIQAYEKPLVLDLDTDITVSFVGD